LLTKQTPDCIDLRPQVFNLGFADAAATDNKKVCSAAENGKYGFAARELA